MFRRPIRKKKSERGKSATAFRRDGPRRKSPSLTESRRISWVLTTGVAGMRSQALGLAEAVGLPIVEKQVAGGSLWSQLATQIGGDGVAKDDKGLLAPPWPELVIACGQRSAPAALAVKRWSAGRTLAVYVQNPGFGADRFDLIVAMEHDRLSGPNVLTVGTALHRVTPERLAAAGEEWRAGLAPAHAPLLRGSRRRRQRQLSPDEPRRRAAAFRVAHRAIRHMARTSSSRRRGARAQNRQPP